MWQHGACPQASQHVLFIRVKLLKLKKADIVIHISVVSNKMFDLNTSIMYMYITCTQVK